MKMTYIPKIQGNMKGYKTIYTTRATSRIIDGSYNSIYKGRSMNFDELREYVVGDDIKDVDWKASSRSQKILVRQYIAEKKKELISLVHSCENELTSFDTQNEEIRQALIRAQREFEAKINEINSLSSLVALNAKTNTITSIKDKYDREIYRILHPVVIPEVKPQKKVREVQRVVLFNQTSLTTEEEIDEYLSRIRNKLVSYINDNEEIKIK